MSSDSTKPSGKKKVVKVTRIIKRKVVASGGPTGELDPELRKVFNSRLEKIENPKENSEITNDQNKTTNTTSYSSHTAQSQQNPMSGSGSTGRISKQLDESHLAEVVDSQPLPVSNIDDIPPLEEDDPEDNLVEISSQSAAQITSSSPLAADTSKSPETSQSPALADESGFLSASSDTDTASSSTAAGKSRHIVLYVFDYNDKSMGK